MLGKRVSIQTHYGHRAEAVPILVRGEVVEVLVRPWGTDALVKLDSPALAGNPDHLPVEYLSLSVGSPQLSEEDE